MELKLFIKGALIGFAIAAPVGPIGILCIRRTLQYGRLSGLFTGLGAAVADSLYGAIAAFGLTILSNALIRGEFWLRFIGGLFLLYLGMRTFFAPSGKEKEKVSHSTLLSDFFSTFFLTLTNPMTIFSFLAIFAGLGFTSIEGNYILGGWLVFGVFSGSILWWLILSEGIAFFRKHLSNHVMSWINRIAGSIIMLFGFGALLTAFL